MPDVREYTVGARSTDTFGRVLCSARAHHFVADGPVENGCPGEAVTPAELFLAGVASCAVELIQVLAARERVPVRAVEASIRGVIDRSAPVRPDVTVFNQVTLEIELSGPSDEQAGALVEAFKGR